MLHPPNPTSIVSDAPEQLHDLNVQLAAHFELREYDFPTAIKQKEWPAVLILHLHSEDMALLDMVDYLRKQAPTAQLYVLCQDCSANFIIAAYERGADACLLMPLDTSALISRLSEATKREESPVLKADLTIQFLGNFTIKTKHGQFIDLKGRCDSIFACLLYHAKEGISRDRLINYFWPEVAEGSARNSLNVAISTIRAHLRETFAEQEVIVLQNNTYFINSILVLQSDLTDFTTAVKQTRALLRSDIRDKRLETSLIKTITAYQGDFLPGFHYENWAVDTRDHYWEEHLFALQQLLCYYQNKEQFDEVVEIAKAILQKDDCQEMTHRRLMYAYFRLGRRSKALQQYRRCAQQLLLELEILPSAETRKLYEIIVQEEQKLVCAPLI